MALASLGFLTCKVSQMISTFLFTSKDYKEDQNNVFSESTLQILSYVELFSTPGVPILEIDLWPNVS